MRGKNGKNGTLLGYRVRIGERWARFFHKLLKCKSLKLDPTIISSYFHHGRFKYHLEKNNPWTSWRKLRACRIGKW